MARAEEDLDWDMDVALAFGSCAYAWSYESSPFGCRSQVYPAPFALFMLLRLRAVMTCGNSRRSATSKHYIAPDIVLHYNGWWVRRDATVGKQGSTQSESTMDDGDEHGDRPWLHGCEGMKEGNVFAAYLLLYFLPDLRRA